MKTPTLIVRILGLYLLTTCSIGLLQMHRIQTLAPNVPTQQANVFGDLQIYLSLGLLVGLAATRFAGPLARVLTFDSERKEKNVDFTDVLLGAQGKTPAHTPDLAHEDENKV